MKEVIQKIGAIIEALDALQYSSGDDMYTKEDELWEELESLIQEYRVKFVTEYGVSFNKFHFTLGDYA